MKYLLLSLLIFGLGISGSLGQTIKSLGYDTSNGVVVANTGTNVLTFTNNVSVGGLSVSDKTISYNNMSLSFKGGMQSGLFFDEVGFDNASGSWRVGGFGSFVDFENHSISGLSLYLNDSVSLFFEDNSADTTRANLGLGWSALTNTNAATSLLGINSNGQLVYTNANTLTITNLIIGQITYALELRDSSTGARALGYWSEDDGWDIANPQLFRANLGFSTNLTNFWQATNALSARSALNVAPAPIFKVLTNDFSITNQTNMTTVDGLTFVTEENKRYVVKLNILLSQSVTSTEIIILATNATVFGTWASANLTAANFSTQQMTNAIIPFLSSNTRGIPQIFYVTSGTNNGNIAVQFRSTSATNTNTFHAGSFILAQEVEPTP